jgi:hypothetical protein
MTGKMIARVTPVLPKGGEKDNDEHCNGDDGGYLFPEHKFPPKPSQIG